MGVVLGMRLFSGLPIRSRRYSGGSSHDLAGLGMSSARKNYKYALKLNEIRQHRIEKSTKYRLYQAPHQYLMWWYVWCARKSCKICCRCGQNKKSNSFQLFVFETLNKARISVYPNLNFWGA